MNNVFDLTWDFMKARKARDYYKHQKIAMPPGMKLMDHKGKSHGTLGKKHTGKDSLSLSQYINSLSYRMHGSKDEDAKKKLTNNMMLNAVSPENPYNLQFLSDHSKLGKTMAMNPLAINNDGHHVSGPNGDHEHHDRFTNMYPEHHFNENGQAGKMKMNPKPEPEPAPELESEPMDHSAKVREAINAVGPDHEKIMEYISNMSAQPQSQPEPMPEPRPQVGVTGQTSLGDFGFN
jgi:hypothetical protein|tara:strand:- start:124 stop:825 length:702 start_codon:yes stop_codon:yes gene_type:complete